MNEELLLRAAKEFGSPLYLFDLDALTAGIDNTRELLGQGISLCYAMKANPFLTKEMAARVENIEVCSPGELQICIALGVPMEQIIFSGVLKDERDLVYILSSCDKLPLFTAESAEQLRRLAGLSLEYKRQINVLPRLTSGNQFGMDEETLLAVLHEVKDAAYMHIKGIHFYSGTQKRKAAQIVKELENLNRVCLRIKSECGIQMEHLEYGPGFGVEYFVKTAGCDDASEMQKTKELLLAARECAEHLTFGGTVTFEMGRYFAAMCGYYLTKVREVKENCGVHYCLVDGGLHHLNYDGQVMAMKTPHCEQIPNRMDAVEEVYQVCGALCTVNDILVKHYPLRGILPGDYLVFERTGAYSMTEGMSLFLSRDLPAVVTYRSKSGFTVLRTHTPIHPLNTPNNI